MATCKDNLKSFFRVPNTYQYGGNMSLRLVENLKEMSPRYYSCTYSLNL